MIARPAWLVGALAAAALAAAGVAASAATTINVKLGLWEVTTTTQTGGAPPIDTSTMTPEQRARVEAMIAGRQGGRGTARTTRECLTKEKLEKGLFDEHDAGDPSCKQTIVTQSATALEVKLECSGERKISGEMRFRALTPENVTGTMKANMEGAGHTMTVNSAITAKYLSSSCGDVK